MGRFHAYEGHPMSDVVFPMRVFGALGVKMTIVTNAAGGLREDLKPGTIVALVRYALFYLLFELTAA